MWNARGNRAASPMYKTAWGKKDANAAVHKSSSLTVAESWLSIAVSAVALTSDTRDQGLDRERPSTRSPAPSRRRPWPERAMDGAEVARALPVVDGPARHNERFALLEMMRHARVVGQCHRTVEQCVQSCVCAVLGLQWQAVVSHTRTVICPVGSANHFQRSC